MRTRRVIRTLRPAMSGQGEAEAPHAASHRPTLLGWRLTGLGLNPRAVERHHPHMAAKLHATCALCANKQRCLEDMMDFRNPACWESYCPNAGAIRALAAGEQPWLVRIAWADDGRKGA